MRIDGAMQGGVRAAQVIPKSAEDGESRELTRQIQEKKQQLMALRDDESMIAEEKQRKRQELLREIAELERQKRQGTSGGSEIGAGHAGDDRFSS